MFAVALLCLGLGSQLPRIVVDTDPENMLPADQGARVLHDAVKRDFTLYDMLVVGIVDDTDADGVFAPATLARIHELTRRIQTMEGVVRQEVLSLSTVDNIEQGGPGVVRFGWLMEEPPGTRDAARALRDAADRLPTIRGTLVSEDGRAAAIYVPVERKRDSRRIAGEIEAIVAGFDGTEQYHVTGLPVAEDTFGVEMFTQMAVTAPLAGLVVLLLMWFFFRSLVLVAAPMILAIVTIVATMGLMVGLGFTVHIMSSMIPIFLMPIAVVDSVHILSEFADRYARIGDRRETVRKVLDDLRTPMLYTSLTSAAGFASLALAPIPPVRVFGIFVAVGIIIAFALTLTLIPAYIAMLSDASIEKLRTRDVSRDNAGLLARLLGGVGAWTQASPRVAVALTVAMIAVSVLGISRIEINDNPVRWFRPDHKIRVADRVLNEHFAGTYNAFLVLQAGDASEDRDALIADVRAYLEAAADGGPDLTGAWSEATVSAAAELAPRRGGRRRRSRALGRGARSPRGRAECPQDLPDARGARVSRGSPGRSRRIRARRKVERTPRHRKDGAPRAARKRPGVFHRPGHVGRRGTDTPELPVVAQTRRLVAFRHARLPGGQRVVAAQERGQPGHAPRDRGG